MVLGTFFKLGCSWLFVVNVALQMILGFKDLRFNYDVFFSIHGA